MKASILINNIKAIYTPFLNPPVYGNDMNQIKTIEHAFIAIKDSVILDFGQGKGLSYIDSFTEVVDANQMIVIPGLIDSHTHLVHAGSREDEFKKLQQGIPYLDILNAGGGILGTVEKTRAASFESLYQQALNSLNQMLSYGVTTVESKSGYGLNLETEIKQLMVNKELNQNHPVTLHSTYMGAHAIPKSHINQRENYIVELKEDMKVIKELNLAESVDVFCEEGIFSLEETKDLLSHAKSLGFSIKMHADEIHPIGGAGLGVKLACTSVDHLMAIKDEDIISLAHSKTIANLLPGTSFYLKKKYANARKLIDSGVAVSIAGDYNPGSCPTENFQFIMQLASRELMMTSAEILNAVTINPSYHLNTHQSEGSIELGKDANLVLLDTPNLDYLFYHYGINHTKDVYIKGKRVYSKGQIVRES
jgi:imidazolonepropionase